MGGSGIRSVIPKIFPSRFLQATQVLKSCSDIHIFQYSLQTSLIISHPFLKSKRLSKILQGTPVPASYIILILFSCRSRQIFRNLRVFFIYFRLRGHIPAFFIKRIDSGRIRNIYISARRKYF